GPNKYSGDYAYSYVDSHGTEQDAVATIIFTDKGPRDTTITGWTEADGGNDTLTFGAGISIDDLAMETRGNDLLIGLRDPNNPGASFWSLTDQLRVQNWVDANDRIETFQFADGTTVDVSNLLTAITGSKTDDIETVTVTGDGFLSGDAGNDV